MSNFRLTYTNWIEFFFHTSGTGTTILSIIVFIWIISFLIFLPLHRLGLKNVTKAKKGLIDSVDKVIYLLSKAQYSLSEKQTLQYDPCFALIKTMFGSGHFEYVDNLDTIKENVKKVETLLKQKVISDAEWSKIDNQKSSLKFHDFWKNIFGYELNVVTLWIYSLFW